MFPVEIDFGSISETKVVSIVASIVQVTVGYHLPAAVAGLDEAVDPPGEGGISKYARVIGRIDPIETTQLRRDNSSRRNTTRPPSG
jgi:hypothetical protein